ncbi:hypothetical protein [Chitinophaga barathri]|uniref:DUF4595 domain-containing protein n=1 Tax=Chitinophaga barathri TaxID=1647451 RepID=A0A3N4MB84_9BACT|nr:hypothetical protein [Chitinophaga barathri]RPD39006.1 hypothetical protein EG028_22990 [Chitinophaga barathri]
MLKRFLPLLILPFCFWACKKSGGARPSESGVDSLSLKYTMGIPLAYIPGGTGVVIPPAGGPSKFYFTYVNGKVARRDGGYVPIATSSGWSYMYSLDVFEKVEYLKDSIIITQDDSRPDLEVMPFRRKLLIENGRLKTKIYYDERGPEWNDTLLVSYGPNGKVSRTEKYNQNVRVVKTFSYSGAGNLEKILGASYFRSDGQQYGESTETFEGYDNKTNPLKNLWLWDETFYRSLSNNNFTKYESASMNNGSLSRSSSSWTLVYDKQGNVQFGL